jgi:predicted TIM-barrel fold metal-dependent hydrolase
MPSDYILYGSDSPWCNHRAMYETVNAADISKQSKQNILYNNFLRLIE